MRRPLLILACVLSLGMAIYFSGESEERFFSGLPFYRQSLEKNEGGKGITVCGKVKEILRKGERYCYIIRGPEETGTFYGYSPDFYPEALGASVTLTGDFGLFSEGRNPGDFSAKAYYDALDIFLKMEITGWHKIGNSFRPLGKLLLKIREKAYETLEKYGEEEKGIFLLFLFNDSSFFAEEKENYAFYGLSYLFSQTGFFISTFGLALMHFLSKKIRSRVFSTLITASVVLCYGALTGFSFSFLRGFTVVLLKGFAGVTKRKYDYLSALSFTYIGLLIEHPGIVLLSQFRYYIAVLFGVGVLAESILSLIRPVRKITRTLIYFLSLYLSILPVSVYENFAVNPYSILILPILGIFKTALVILLLIGTYLSVLSPIGKSGIALFFYGGGRIIVHIFDFTLKVLPKLPFSSIVLGKPGEIRVILFYVLLLGFSLFFRYLFRKNKNKKEGEEVLLSRKRIRPVYLGFLLFFGFGILFLRSDTPRAGNAEICVLDVGQGEGILVLTKTESILIDGGSSSKNSVSSIISKALRFFGRDGLTKVFLSHGDADHTNGVVGVLENETIPVGMIILPSIATVREEFSSILNVAENKIPIRLLSAGDSFYLDGILFSILAPRKNAKLTGNESSLVLSLESDNFSALFCGDITALAESSLTLKKYTLLKVAHHGSRYSTSEAFLEKTQPEIAVISAGKNNSYGHPHKETLIRLSKFTETIDVTAEKGALWYRFSRGGFACKKFAK